MSKKETTPEYDVCELHHYPKVLFCDATKESLCYACATTPKYSKYYTVSIENLKDKTEKRHQECKDRVGKLSCGMEYVVEGRKKEIMKVDERVTKMMKDVDKFYGKIIERIEAARKSDLEALEVKRKEIVDGMEEDINAVEQFIERVEEFKTRFSGITGGSVNSFTEGVYRSVCEIEELKALKEDVRGRCGKTYEMEFLRSNDLFNKDIYKCIDSLRGGFSFNEFHNSEYLSPSEAKERPPSRRTTPYEYKGETGFGLREKDYYNQRDNTFHTEVEGLGRGSGVRYQLFYDIMKGQPQRLERIKKDISRTCQECVRNTMFDTEKRDILIKGLADTKAEVVKKFGEVVVSVYEARDKTIEDLDREFERRNSVYERTLKEEKICVREGLDAKRECEEIGIWYKHACQSWERSNKPIQEYIQEIGELEKVRDMLVSKKDELEGDRNVSFRMVLTTNRDDDDDGNDGNDFIGYIPRVEFIEFDEAEERAAFIKAVNGVNEEEVLSLIRRGVQDITAFSLAIRYPIDGAGCPDNVNGMAQKPLNGHENDCIIDDDDPYGIEVKFIEPIREVEEERGKACVKSACAKSPQTPKKISGKMPIKTNLATSLKTSEKTPEKISQVAPRKTPGKKPQIAPKKILRSSQAIPIGPSQLDFCDEEPVRFDLNQTPKKSPPKPAKRTPKKK